MIASITKNIIINRRVLRHSLFLKETVQRVNQLQNKNFFEFADWNGLKKNELSAISPIPKI
jgi:hypothetical protein